VTGRNRIENAKDELLRAEECLREARALQAARLPYGAASRAYYAVFHAVRAVLFASGLEVRSHRAAVGLLGEHYVKTGKLKPEIGRLIAHLQRDREDADYMTGAVFTQEEADDALQTAELILGELRQHLPDP
jgi:uncharacterized protein (UPF0332 family)